MFSWSSPFYPWSGDCLDCKAVPGCEDSSGDMRETASQPWYRRRSVLQPQILFGSGFAKEWHSCIHSCVCESHLVAKVRSLSPESPFCIYIQRWHKHLKKTYSCVGTENNLRLFGKIRNVFKHMILSLYTQMSPDLHLFMCLFAEEI